MARFHIEDFNAIENTAASPANLRAHLGEMIVNSLKVRAHVESVNAQTGEYRIVLQGTLDTKPSTTWKED